MATQSTLGYYRVFSGSEESIHRAILGSFPRQDLVRMALVNKRWAELCNRIIWSRIRQLKALEGLLPTSWFSINSIYPMKLCKRHKFRVSSNGEGYADCRVCSKIKDSQQQWENFLQHTSWIQTFVYNAPLGSCNAPLKRFMNFSKIFSAGIMMPNLRFVKLILGHSKEALQGAVYFLAETPSLKTLTVSTHCRNQQLLSRLIDTIARRCEQLEYINLTIPDAVSAEAIEEGFFLMAISLPFLCLLNCPKSIVSKRAFKCLDLRGCLVLRS